MELDDFISDFPDKWIIYYNIPQLKRELTKKLYEEIEVRIESIGKARLNSLLNAQLEVPELVEASIKKLINRLEEWIERTDKGQNEPRDSDLKKVGFGSYSKNMLLSKLEQELGETKAKKCLLELKRWFERLKYELVEPLDSDLRNDLFFGFLIMFSNQRGARGAHKGTLDTISEELKYLKTLKRTKDRLPKAHLHNWRKNWQKRFQILIDEFEEKTFLKGRNLSEEYIQRTKQNLRAMFGRLGQEIPKINKEYSAYMSNRLAEKLKGRRDRKDEEYKRVANDTSAAELIKEGSQILGIKIEDPSRLRKYKKPKKTTTTTKPL